MAVIARSLLAAACLTTLSGAAFAQSYDPEDAPEAQIAMAPAHGARATGFAYAREGRSMRGHHRHAHMQRLVVAHGALRGDGAVAAPPVARSAPTLPSIVVYAEPAPRTAYYNEPPTLIVDGLRTHRVAWRVERARCGYGCLRAAY